MTKTRKQYTEQFKRDAVSQLTGERGNLAAVAKQLEIDPSLIHGWRKKFGNGVAQVTHSDPLATVASPLAGSEIGPFTDPGSVLFGDLALEAVWEKAATLPLRQRFALVATAGQRLL